MVSCPQVETMIEEIGFGDMKRSFESTSGKLYLAERYYKPSDTGYDGWHYFITEIDNEGKFVDEISKVFVGGITILPDGKNVQTSGSKVTEAIKKAIEEYERRKGYAS